jgi:hypothetical protein
MSHSKVINLVLLVFFFLSFSVMGKGEIIAKAAPEFSTAAPGQSIEVPVIVDMSLFKGQLGSFTASLQWDAGVLQYLGFSGGASEGFENPVVNAENAPDGTLRFANASAAGADGGVNVLKVRFKVIGRSGSSCDISLYFTAMAGAKTFANLLPHLDTAADSKFHLEVSDQPQEYGLDSFPNPFNPVTVVRYNLPRAGEVNIAIYNVLGQKVRTLVEQRQPAGDYEVEWNGKNDQEQLLPSGMYFLRMQAGKFLAQRKLLFLK